MNDFKKNSPTGSDPNLDFVIMPKMSENQQMVKTDLKKTASRPLSQNRRKFLVIGAGVLTALVLGALAYFAYERFSSPSSSSSSQPEVLVPVTKQPDADSDNDGLTDAREKALGTNQNKADSDGDGLADGDEVNVYASDPLLPDTDGDKYDDGQEVARAYSPISNSVDAASVTERQKWLKNSVEFGLHEPTSTTLKSKAAAGQPIQSGSANTTAYINKVYGYSMEIPPALGYQEQKNGRDVGIYIASTVPEDNAEQDPFYVALAGRTDGSGQSLRSWAETQYPVADYEKLQEFTINSQPAVRLFGLKSDVCSQDKTFFVKNGSVIAVTWTCADTGALGQYYDQIVNSFKFQ